MNYFNNLSYMNSHIFLMLFLYLFLTHRYSKAVTRWLCFLSFFLLTVTDFFKLNLFPDSNICYVVVTIFQILVTQLTGLLISAKRDGRALFMGLSSSNYVIVGSISAAILYIYTENAVLALTVSFLIHFLTLYILVKNIRESWLRQCEVTYTKNYWELCLIPVFFYCSFCFIAFFPHTLYENPENILGILCFMITMFVSYVVIIRYLESDSKQKDTYWKNILFQSYIEGLEHQYDLIERSENNLKILRHNMRHYSDMINLLLDTEEYEEIKKITSHINRVVDENKIVKYCDNLVVNTILSQMMQQAEELSVRTHLDLTVSKEIPVNDYEFTTVIANLFENSIFCVKHFVPEKRYVKLKIHCTMDHLLIQIKNEYEKEIIFDKVTGLPKSSRGENHGLGLQNVSSFSEKIGGSFDCFCQDGIFQVVLFSKF